MIYFKMPLVECINRFISLFNLHPYYSFTINPTRLTKTNNMHIWTNQILHPP